LSSFGQEKGSPYCLKFISISLTLLSSCGVSSFTISLSNLFVRILLPGPRWRLPRPGSFYLPFFRAEKGICLRNTIFLDPASSHKRAQNTVQPCAKVRLYVVKRRSIEIMARAQSVKVIVGPSGLLNAEINAANIVLPLPNEASVCDYDLVVH